MKLLIVDDEADLCRLLAEHFEGHFDAEVFTATTPAEALRVLEAQQPVGMLLDINLGARLNGFDILQRLPEISPATKVIMVTSVNEFTSIERAMELGECGLVDLKGLITHEFPLEDVAGAFARAEKRGPDILKAVVLL